MGRHADSGTYFEIYSYRRRVDTLLIVTHMATAVGALVGWSMRDRRG